MSDPRPPEERSRGRSLPGSGRSAPATSTEGATMTVEFGIFQNGATDLPTKVVDEMVVPDGDLQALAESYARVQIGQIRQGVLADQLGFDYYFMSEHHFRPEGAEFSPSPLLAETATAALTKRIRLAQGTNVTPEHHPVRIAEQAAML